MAAKVAKSEALLHEQQQQQQQQEQESKEAEDGALSQQGFGDAGLEGNGSSTTSADNGNGAGVVTAGGSGGAGGANTNFGVEIRSEDAFFELFW